MMTSVDLSSSSRSAGHPLPGQRLAANRGGFYGGAGPPGSGGSGGLEAAGRIKTEQVIVEFFFKVAELVLQSRVQLPTENEHGNRGHRRARFNLDIEEIPFIRDAMTPWKEDVHRPLVIDIYVDQNDGGGGRGGPSRVLLERWRVEYASVGPPAETEYHSPYAGRRQSSPAFQSPHHSSSPLAMSAGHSQNVMAGGSTRDVIQQLKEVCKKIAVLLRALHSFMRLLPAHRIFRQSYPSTLAYEIHSPEEDVGAVEQRFGGHAVATSQYSFLPITTPFGFLKVTTQYRRDCGALDVRRRVATPLLKDNVIIQDYVPHQVALFPTMTMGLAVLSGDDGRVPSRHE
ncbi:hypothetical protein P43SY_004676 [Pythium insidiosum]|uniref:Autophagy-related protein 13 N-terminal domain-containing protein n=1 Tax=Pythium insidiosum TaxID=114742 RepID=A0AAD5M2M9_PYTIN|nr:hypothetical protein P43SY_004676 [Pythium insidiosum]KAJ0401683.1 hypothetical protein ATCC90586_001489 [Pythium insidiosum]